jgi:hypothetical protein
LIPRAQAIGAAGIRTPASQIKSLLCCRYTTTPRSVVGAFQPANTAHFLSLRKKDQMSLGVESNHRFRLIRATCFRCTTERVSLHCLSRDDWNRTSLHVFPKHAGARSPSSRCFVRRQIDSCGIRTRVAAVKGRNPPVRRTSRYASLSSARTRSASGSGGARILVPWFSARPLNRLSYRPNSRAS